MNELPNQPDTESQVENMQSVGSSAGLKALALVGITTGYIFGPLIIIGGAGWYLGELINAKWVVFVAVLISFIISNVLIFKQAPKATRKIAINKK